MGILTERKSWAKKRDPNERRSSSGLTVAEKANAQLALVVLRAKFGNCARLARAMDVKADTVYHAMRRANVSAGVARKAALVAGVPLDDVLTGRWPGEGFCRHCGSRQLGEAS